MVIVPLIFGLIRRRYFNSGERMLLYLMGVSLVVEVLNYTFLKLHRGNLYAYRVYTVLEFALISLFYIRTIIPTRLETILKLIIPLFLLVAVYDFYRGGAKLLDEIPTTVEAILLIVYSIICYYMLLQNPIHASVFSIPLFWLNTAILLYFSGNLFVFIFITYAQKTSKALFYEVWGIHSVMNILFYLLISIGFWKTKER